MASPLAIHLESSPDIDILNPLADFICGDEKTRFPVYRSSYFLTRFFQNLDIDVTHDGSARKRWVSEVLKQLQPSDIEKVILRLADPREYKGVGDDLKLAVHSMNEILLLASLAIEFDSARPFIKRAESLNFDEAEVLSKPFDDDIQPQELGFDSPPAHGTQTTSNVTSSSSQERKISAITRRDIIDKLRSWEVEGRLDLIEFLEMTWPNLASMPSPSAGMSLAYEISLAYESPNWDSDFDFFSYLFYSRLKLGSCDDELFLSFLVSCIHPLVRTDKKKVAELLSFFNEALYLDGYALKPASIQSGRPIYKAFAIGTNDEEYIVSRAVEIIEQLARKFHLVVRKLSQRYNDRPAFEIRDEYDVQDLFYALLAPFFEDIRPEEVAPSHAGGHGRIDFLIKTEQIVIEIKKTRPSLKVKELRDQLIVDKEIYRTHPHCRNFIAFVYDPDGYIGNSIGFERDLSNTSGDMQVKVIVAPR